MKDSFEFLQKAFRLIAATNVDLEVLVNEGQSRVDLFYRLQMFTFALTPLRQRKDIDFLALYFAKKAAQEFGLRKPKLNVLLVAALSCYHWPGNLRELEHLMHRLVIRSRTSELDLKFVPHWIKGGLFGLWGIESIGLEEIEEIGPVESDVIKEVLRKMKGNQVRAARLLGITSTDLRKRLNKTDTSNRIHRS
jgi:Nif-specific regulatory protein